MAFLFHRRNTLLLAPVWVSVWMLAVGFLSPGYSHISQHVSELAAEGAPYSLWMSFGGVLPFGLLVFFGGASVAAGEWRRREKIAYQLLCLSGGFFVLVALFPCDAGCPWRWRQISLSANIHNFSAHSAFVSSIVAQLILGGLSFQYADSYYRCCLFLGVLSAVLYILLQATSPPLAEGELSHYKGLTQRLFMLTYFVWLAAVWRRDKIAAPRRNDD